MSIVTDGQIQLIVSGLALFHELVGQVDEAMLARALTRKIVVGGVTRVPSWESTEAFVNANPEFVATEPLNASWNTRQEPQSRIRLMIALARHLRENHEEEAYLFTPEVRENPGIVASVASMAGAIRDVLEDPALSHLEKTVRITTILKEVLQ